VEGEITWVEVGKSVLDAEMFGSSTTPERFILNGGSETELTVVLKVDPRCVYLH